MQDGRVQRAPGLGAVRRDRTGEEVRGGAVDQVEGAVAREEEGVALGGGRGEGLQGLGERNVEVTYTERVREGGQRLRDRQIVQQAVDRADPERVARGVHQEHEAVVPGAG